MVAATRGALIVIEGIHRSGKTTQAKLLVESLNKQRIPAELISFPERTSPSGVFLDEYLKNLTLTINEKALHLVFSGNRWEQAERITTALRSGVTVILDRYSYSGIAFSAVNENMDIEWCKQSENGLPKPDLVFLLNLAIEEMERRPGFGVERYENVEVQSKVIGIFNKLCEENWEKIDAAAPIHQVQGKLLELVLRKIKEVEKQPLAVFKF